MATSLEKRFGLQGQIALVTGGTKGIGRAIVEELAAAGARVFTCSRSESDISELSEGSKAKGFDVQAWKCQLSRLVAPVAAYVICLTICYPSSGHGGRSFKQ